MLFLTKEWSENMAKKKKKPKDKIRAKIKAKKQLEKKEKNNVLYICTECEKKELIPKNVVMQFDIMDNGDTSEPPRFTCEKCGGLMYPQKYEGVHGITYCVDKP